MPYNVEQKPFSYDEYRTIISKYKPTVCDYAEVFNKTSFSIIRHDVEFSPHDAVEIAKIDHELGISSTFFFQTNSGAYNLSSFKNQERLRFIDSLGHHVGLHFYVTQLEENDWKGLYQELDRQTEILAIALGQRIDRFSFHRPPKWALARREDYMNGMINAYGPSFFEFTLDCQPGNIKYFADSNHQWKYGYALDEFPHQQYQILLHPDEWSQAGCVLSENFKRIIHISNHEYFNVLKKEYLNFPVEIEDEFTLSR